MTSYSYVQSPSFGERKRNESVAVNYDNTYNNYNYNYNNTTNTTTNTNMIIPFIDRIYHQNNPNPIINTDADTIKINNFPSSYDYCLVFKKITDLFRW